MAKMQKTRGLITESRTTYEVSIERNGIIGRFSISTLTITVNSGDTERTHLIILKTMSLRKK